MNKGVTLIDLVISIALIVLVSLISFDFIIEKKDKKDDTEVKKEIKKTALNTFELSAKLILKTAEATSLIEQGEESCFDLMKTSMSDYDKCIVKFNKDDVIIDIYGKKGSRFNKFHCIGNKSNMYCSVE